MRTIINILLIIVHAHFIFGQSLDYLDDENFPFGKKNNPDTNINNAELNADNMERRVDDSMDKLSQDIDNQDIYFENTKKQNNRMMKRNFKNKSKFAEKKPKFKKGLRMKNEPKAISVNANSDSSDPKNSLVTYIPETLQSMTEITTDDNSVQQSTQSFHTYSPMEGNSESESDVNDDGRDEHGDESTFSTSPQLVSNTEQSEDDNNHDIDENTTEYDDSTEIQIHENSEHQVSDSDQEFDPHKSIDNIVTSFESPLNNSENNLDLKEEADDEHESHDSEFESSLDFDDEDSTIEPIEDVDKEDDSVDEITSDLEQDNNRQVSNQSITINGKPLDKESNVYTEGEADVNEGKTQTLSSIVKEMDQIQPNVNMNGLLDGLNNIIEKTEDPFLKLEDDMNSVSAQDNFKLEQSGHINISTNSETESSISNNEVITSPSEITNETNNNIKEQAHNIHENNNIMDTIDNIQTQATLLYTKKSDEYRTTDSEEITTELPSNDVIKAQADNVKENTSEFVQDNSNSEKSVITPVEESLDNSETNTVDENEPQSTSLTDDMSTPLEITTEINKDIKEQADNVDENNTEQETTTFDQSSGKLFGDNSTDFETSTIDDNESESSSSSNMVTTSSEFTTEINNYIKEEADNVDENNSEQDISSSESTTSSSTMITSETIGSNADIKEDSDVIDESSSDGKTESDMSTVIDSEEPSIQPMTTPLINTESTDDMKEQTETVTNMTPNNDNIKDSADAVEEQQTDNSVTTVQNSEQELNGNIKAEADNVRDNNSQQSSDSNEEIKTEADVTNDMNNEQISSTEQSQSLVENNAIKDGGDSVNEKDDKQFDNADLTQGDNSEDLDPNETTKSPKRVKRIKRHIIVYQKTSNSNSTMNSSSTFLKHLLFQEMFGNNTKNKTNTIQNRFKESLGNMTKQGGFLNNLSGYFKDQPSNGSVNSTGAQNYLTKLKNLTNNSILFSNPGTNNTSNSSFNPGVISNFKSKFSDYFARKRNKRDNKPGDNDTQNTETNKQDHSSDPSEETIEQDHSSDPTEESTEQDHSYDSTEEESTDKVLTMNQPKPHIIHKLGIKTGHKPRTTTNTESYGFIDIAKNSTKLPNGTSSSINSTKPYFDQIKSSAKIFGSKFQNYLDSFKKDSNQNNISTKEPKPTKGPPDPKANKQSNNHDKS